MEALIVNFRQGRHTQTNNQMILKINGVDSKDKAAKLMGKKVSYKTPTGKEIKGKVQGTHGNNGALRVLFEKGMPGQAIGKKVVVE